LRLLAFDTLGPALSAAAVDTGAPATPVAERAEAVQRGQAERILPLVEAVLADAGWSWPQLDLLAVTVGPGGFTAIRTGVALARALALALDRPGLAVGTLEAIAEAAAPGPLLALKDLRRGQLAAQPFDAALLPAAEPRLVSPEDATALAAAFPKVAGDGVALLGPVGLGHRAVEAAPSARYVALAACRRWARGEGPAAGTMLRPFYLRPPDAALAAGRPLVAALAAR